MRHINIGVARVHNIDNCIADNEPNIAPLHLFSLRSEFVVVV